MAFSLRAVAVLAFLGATSAKIIPKKTFAPPISLLSTKQLSIRGGAGPVDATTMAKAYVVAGLVQGTYTALAPEPSLKAYSGTPTPMSVVTAKRLGVSVLAHSAAAASMLFQDRSLNTAVGIVTSIWTFVLLGDVLNETGKTVGYNGQTDIFWLVLNAAMAYIAFSDLDVAPKVIKAYYIFVLVAFDPPMFSPASASKVYGIDNPDELTLDYFRSTFGVISASAVFFLSLIYGAGVSKAVGYSTLNGILDLLSGPLFTETDRVNKKGPLYAWLAFNIVTAVTCALD